MMATPTAAAVDLATRIELRIECDRIPRKE
jgi:hypothetical protein